MGISVGGFIREAPECYPRCKCYSSFQKSWTTRVVVVVCLVPQCLHAHEGCGKLPDPGGEESLLDYSLAFLPCCPVVQRPGSVGPRRVFSSPGRLSCSGVCRGDGQRVEQGVVGPVHCGFQVDLSGPALGVASSRRQFPGNSEKVSGFQPGFTSAFSGAVSTRTWRRRTGSVWLDIPVLPRGATACPIVALSILGPAGRGFRRRRCRCGGSRLPRGQS